jgi:hypothetical protein
MPQGFRAAASGLLVPEELAREKTTFTWQQWRDLEKVTKMLEASGLTLQFKCTDPRCQRSPIQRLRTLDGGITFRCEHMDRSFTKAF